MQSPRALPSRLVCPNKRPENRLTWDIGKIPPKNLWRKMIHAP
ncbi:MAG: hypothetical protein GHCLOJNM_01033 [bacterium]|nr:hypothetical protein [bacterium]